jgi:hypothetical protein
MKNMVWHGPFGKEWLPAAQNNRKIVGGNNNPFVENALALQQSWSVLWRS